MRGSVEAFIDPLKQEWLVDETVGGCDAVIYVERTLSTTGEKYAHVLFEADWGELEHAEHIAKLHNIWLAKQREDDLAGT